MRHRWYGTLGGRIGGLWWCEATHFLIGRFAYGTLRTDANRPMIDGRTFTVRSTNEARRNALFSVQIAGLVRWTVIVLEAAGDFVTADSVLTDLYAYRARMNFSRMIDGRVHVGRLVDGFERIIHIVRWSMNRFLGGGDRGDRPASVRRLATGTTARLRFVRRHLQHALIEERHTVVVYAFLANRRSHWLASGLSRWRSVQLWPVFEWRRCRL